MLYILVLCFLLPNLHKLNTAFIGKSIRWRLHHSTDGILLLTNTTSSRSPVKEENFFAIDATALTSITPWPLGWFAAGWLSVGIVEFVIGRNKRKRVTIPFSTRGDETKSGTFRTAFRTAYSTYHRLVGSWWLPSTSLRNLGEVLGSYVLALYW